MKLLGRIIILLVHFQFPLVLFELVDFNFVLECYAFTQEMTMHLRWVGNHYTIVVNSDDTVKDLKIAVFQALRVQPRLQRVR